MVKIDEENSVPVKTTIGGAESRRPTVIYIPKILEDLMVKIERGDIVLNVDRKNKIIWFPYEEATS